jgi:hypothetical protein
MPDLSFPQISRADPYGSTNGAARSRTLDGTPHVGAAIPGLDALLSARAIRLDSRAKCASGTIFHWVRVVEINGREIASSGGWYEREVEAIRHAIDMLGSVDGLMDLDALKL